MHILHTLSDKMRKMRKCFRKENFTLFDDIKSALDMPAVVRGYGLKINRSGLAICPFHAEKTPSAKIYPDAFHCFGCGVHADVIGFTQRLFGLARPIDAAKKLNDDFYLHLDVGGKAQSAQVSEYRRRQQEREEYERWEREAWNTLRGYLRTMYDWREMVPKSPDEEPDPRFAYALGQAGYAEYLCEEFIAADENGRKAMRAEVERAEGFLGGVSDGLKTGVPAKRSFVGKSRSSGMSEAAISNA